MGDGLVQGGSFTFFGEENTQLRIWDSNNHQATFGVLGAAVMAVFDYMNSQAHFGTGTFAIFDGPNQVGRGFVGRGGG